MRIKMIGLMLSVLLCFAPSVVGSQSMPLEAFSTLAPGNNFLVREAGISAYIQVASLSAVQLDNAEAAMKLVELKTADYIVGSVGLENYDKKYDVHVYVDRAGWVVAYYSRNAHAAKIIDFVGFAETGRLTTPTLEMALAAICQAMFVTPANVKYYDFRYPEATRIIVAVDKEDRHEATSSFTVNAPMSLTVYDRTWSHRVQVFRYAASNYSHYLQGNIKIDDTVLHEFDSLPTDGEQPTADYQPWHSWEGILTQHQLYPDRYCTISVYNYNYRWDSCSSFSCAISTGYVGICIIYSE